MALEAGAARREITPEKPAFLVGYPHVDRISTGVHDPLSAAAICMSCDGTGAILVALDILFLAPPTARRLRAAIAARVGVPESHVFISCTHTHSGPVTVEMLAWSEDRLVPPPDPSYVRLLEERTLAAAVDAAEHARPAELAWTSARVEGAGGNRRDPDGAVDPEAGILVVRDTASRRAMTLSVTYSMHPTVLHEDSTLVSSDFPHYARSHLIEGLGEELVVLYHTGPSGNQSPRRFVRGQTFAEAERLGRKVGEAVLEAVRGLGEEAFTSESLVAGALAQVELVPREFPSLRDAEETLERTRGLFERLRSEGAPRAEVRTAECAVFGAEESVSLARGAAAGEAASLVERYRRAEVQALRIGDAILVGLPGELFVEYGLAIKREAPRRTFVASLVNGELQGYIVTPEAAAAGGYEALNALFAPSSGQALVEAAARLTRELDSVRPPEQGSQR